MKKLKSNGMPDNSPTGLPKVQDNSDSGNVLGEYEQEGLAETPIQNMVTGSGGGPILGGGRSHAVKGAR